MHSFCDTDGNAWRVAVTLREHARFKSQLGVDIFTLLDDSAALLNRLHTDWDLIGNMLMICVAGQMADRDYSAERFVAALAGDVLEDAQAALVDAIVDFFPRQRREALAKMVAKGRQVGHRAQQIAMERTTEALEQLDVDSLARTLTDSAGNAPGSAA